MLNSFSLVGLKIRKQTYLLTKCVLFHSVVLIMDGIGTILMSKDLINNKQKTIRVLRTDFNITYEAKK